MTKTEHYPSQVFWSGEDEGYIALAPDLPGCSAFGVTQGEALAELQDAITAWIDAARAAGNSIPEPSRLPTPVAHSGKVLLRMPKELHAKLASSAEREGVSLNQLMVYMLTNAEAMTSYQHYASLCGAGTTNLVGSVSSTVGINDIFAGKYSWVSGQSTLIGGATSSEVTSHGPFDTIYIVSGPAVAGAPTPDFGTKKYRSLYFKPLDPRSKKIRHQQKAVNG